MFCMMKLISAEERLIQLESLSALQDRTIQQLNEELYTQQKMIRMLQERMEQMEQRVQILGEPGRIAGQERPPHY